MSRFNKRLKAFRKAGARLVVVSADPMSFLKKLQRKMKLRFHLVCDDDLLLIHKMEVREGKRKIARPATFVIDGRGSIRWRHIGNHAMDRPSESAILSAVRAAALASKEK